MIKYKYLISLILLIAVFAAFKMNFDVTQNDSTTDTGINSKEYKSAELLEIEGAIEKYDSILRSDIKSTGTVGSAVVITYKDQIAYLKCFGVKKVGGKDSINENTLFRLASVSKTVTGVLAGILANNKIINLDDKVKIHIPGFQLKDSINTHNLSIRNILSHTSGLVPHAYDNMVEGHVPIKKIIPDLKDVEISAAPGELYGYQNVMYSLFDTISTNVTGKKFDQLLHENIFTPFHMKNASTGFYTFKNSANKAYPHSGTNGNSRILKLNNRYYSTAPAAGINASISDMGQFLLNLLSSNSKTIASEVRNIIFKPQVYTPLRRSYLKNWDPVESRHYGIGWRLIGYKGRKIAYHGGYVKGYKAEVALCEEEDLGIAYITNSPDSVASKSVPTFLNLFFKHKDFQKVDQNSLP